MSSDLEEQLEVIKKMTEAAKLMAKTLDELGAPKKVVRDEKGKIIGVE